VIVSFRALGAVAVGVVLGACGLVESGPAPCRGDVPGPDAQEQPHHDPALEARIPDSLGGEPFTVTSMCANVADPGGLTVAPDLLADVGVELADVSHAHGIPEVGDNVDAQLSAWRYHSATADDLRTAMLAQLAVAGESMRQANVARRSVYVSDGPLMRGTIVYVSGDTVYVLSGSDEQVAELLGALP
jgi:hypothetical protein